MGLTIIIVHPPRYRPENTTRERVAFVEEIRPDVSVRKS